MTMYYTKNQNDEIDAWATYKFSQDCLETNKEIVYGTNQYGQKVGYVIGTQPKSTEDEAVEQARQTAIVQSRHLIQDRMQNEIVKTQSFTASEFQTFADAGLFEEWQANTSYTSGFRLVYENIVYQVIQDVTSEAHQTPASTGMLAVYRPISTSGDEADGTLDNPFIFIFGMDVANKNYYTYESVTYLAKTDMPACVWNPNTAGMWQWEAVVS